MIETFIVYSSNGELIVNKETGEVIKCILSDNNEKDLKKITKFDIEEYKQYWNAKEIPDGVDILNIGYWYRTPSKIKYEKPEADWRNELKLISKNGH